jgi:NAD(P)-dependent dehydrogenase (short-subunit alcohol dehydrogenase family)
MDTRLAVVTGGTRGLGLAIARRLAADGFLPVLVYARDEAAADAARAELSAAGHRVHCARADVGDAAALEQLAARLESELGPVEALVHGAFRGGRPARKVHEIPPEAWIEDLHTNLSGAFFAARAFLPAMRSRGRGRVVLIGSLAERGERGRAAYTVAKSGLVGLARVLAQEYARDGITANVVSPGFIDAGAFLNLSAEIREACARQVPAGRLGRAEEIAAAVAYLVGPDAAYTTGQVLAVNGGAR